jgi:hypothetical protein
VIGVGFVDEASAVRQHRDQAGLCAIDEVREHAERAIASGHPRDRHPSRRVRIALLEGGADLLAETDAVAGVAQRGGGVVAGVVAIMREHLASALLVLRKTAGRQHHAAFGAHENLAFVGGDHRARHHAFFRHEPGRRRTRPDIDAEIECAAE